MAYFLVDPSDKLDWTHDWTDFLGVGDTIASRIWRIAPQSVGTPLIPALLNETTATVIVSGFEAGKVYRLAEEVTTAAGLIGERTIVLRCDDI